MPEHTPPGPPGPPEKGPVSDVQIEALNESRPRPEFVHILTPEGPLVQEANPEHVNRRNAEIDQQVEAMRQRMAQEKDKAREAFKMAHDYGR